MYDVSSFSQDSTSIAQVGDLATNGQFRMMRAILSGVVKGWHPWRYVLAVDYDGFTPRSAHTASIDEVFVIVPLTAGMELAVGRQVSGIGEQIVASSRSLVFTERPASLTGFIPNKNNGVRLMGGAARRGRWSIGWFNPEIMTAGKTASGASEFVGQTFIAPIDEDDGRRLLELGAAARWKGAPDGSLRFRTRPENNSAPDFPDTKSFDATGATTGDVDVTLQRGGISMVTEALLTAAARRDSSTLHFAGYYLEAAWRPGGEYRVFDAESGALGRVRLRNGRPAFEIGARLSHTDLSSQDVDGGVFDRATAVVSWRTSRSLLLEVEYGDATLRRAGGVGHTQFVTTRVQWELR